MGLTYAAPWMLHDSAEGDAEGSLLIAYGINDCEAKLATMRMTDVWAQLRPLSGEASACMTAGGE